MSLEVGAHESNAGVGRRWKERHVALVAAVKADAGVRDRPGYGPLAIGCHSFLSLDSRALRRSKSSGSRAKRA
jgi:hypothetical protein